MVTASKITNLIKSTLYQLFTTVPGSQMRFKAIRPQAPLYDFYLSYTENEKKDVDKVKKLFTQYKSDLKFFMTEQWNEPNRPQFSQEGIFDVMKTCTRFVDLLCKLAVMFFTE